MKSQAVYRSNLDYERTYQALHEHPRIQSIDDKVGAGIVAWFRGSQPFNIRISPRSKVVITYAGDEQLEEALGILEEYGVPCYGSRVSFVFEGWNPPYDKMRYICDRYERGHLLHPPMCTACMMELIQHQILRSINMVQVPDLASLVGEWMERLQGEWMQALTTYVDERIFRSVRDYMAFSEDALGPYWLNRDIASDVLEAMLPEAT